MSSLNQPASRIPAASREAFVEQEFYAGRDFQSGNARATPVTADDVVEFWRQAGPSMWFAKDADFDRRFREAFLNAHEAAARGELDGWLATPAGALALRLLLDQFPRNSFRGSPRMYATDAAARRIAAAAIDAGHDRQMPPDLRKFFYLPFAHSEDLRSGTGGGFCRHLGPPDSGSNAIATSCGASGASIAIRFSATMTEEGRISSIRAAMPDGVICENRFR